MINLKLTAERELSFLSAEKIYAGEKNITPIEIELPDNIGDCATGNCTLTLYAAFEDDTFISYPIENSRIYISGDLTEREQTLRLFIKITSGENVIGLTNAVALKVEKSPEGHTRIYPRAELDAIISRLESENMAMSTSISRLESEASHNSARISELQGQLAESEEENEALTADNARKDRTISNLSENLNPIRFQTKTVTPAGTSQLISPDSGCIGLSAVMVNAVSAAGDADLIPENIRNGVDVFGVRGTLKAAPANTVGGVYFTTPNNYGVPTKCRVFNYPMTEGIDFPSLFIGNTTLREVEFENCSHIEFLPDLLFSGCSSLRSVVLPDSLEAISGGMFYGASQLTSVTIPETVTTLNDSAFADCSSLISVNIPSAVTFLPYNLFFGCSSLSTVEIPYGVTTIDEFAFSQSGVINIALPNTVTLLRSYIFANCRSLLTLDLTALDHVPAADADILFGVNQNCKIIVANNQLKSLFTAATNWSYYASKFVTREEYENGAGQ